MRDYEDYILPLCLGVAMVLAFVVTGIMKYHDGVREEELVSLKDDNGIVVEVTNKDTAIDVENNLTYVIYTFSGGQIDVNKIYVDKETYDSVSKKDLIRVDINEDKLKFVEVVK